MHVLENERLAVQLYDWPGVARYTHKPTGGVLFGGDSGRGWTINGRPTVWSDWRIRISVDPDGSAVEYRLELPSANIELNVSFRLADGELAVTIAPDPDRSESLERIDWGNAPLLVCRDAGFSFARTELHQRGWKPIPNGGHGLYERRKIAEKIGDLPPDGRAVPTMQACLFDGETVCFVRSNYPVAPLVTELSATGRHPGRADGFSIGPAEYRYRVRGTTMEPLRLSVVFLPDTNGDGMADECDYELWLNRTMPRANPLYKEAIWYKIFCADPKRGVMTTFKETLDIIRRVHRITDGARQIVYLVGWQFDGHDTGYPALDRLNESLAERPGHAREELLALVRTAREKYDCIVSYHINVDDAYRSSPAWKPELLSRDPDGRPRVWIDPGQTSEGHDGRAYHISHTKDVESGDVFRRLDALLALVPATDTIHIDAFRNTNASWEEDGGYIGPLEELVCGMKPIIAYFNDRGIDVSTEGQNGMPVEDAGLFSAYWHFSPSLAYHGVIVGGGSVDMNAVAWGKGASIDADVLYVGEPSRLEGERVASSDFATKWHQIVDILYLGSMLYRFYLEREMVELRENESEIAIRFADGVRAKVDKRAGTLSVRWGELVIAEDDDRFVPAGDRIFLYSRPGSEREWTLPAGWRSGEAEWRAYRLTGEGREPTQAFAVSGDRLRIRLEPNVPVVLERKR